MATASDSTTASLIPFPARYGRNGHPFTPDPLHRAIDDWARTRNVALAAASFRGLNEGDAARTVRKLILEGGAAAVAKLLEETGLAIRSMRRILDELVAIDGIIAAAADRVLKEAEI